MTAAELDIGRFTAVVFDMDGVITDTASVHAVAWTRTFDEFLARRRGAPFTHDDYLQYVDGIPRDAGVERFLASRGITLPRGTIDDPPARDTIWGLANRKNRAFLAALDENRVYAFPSSVVFVRELQAHAVRTAIVSASRNCQTVLESAGIGDLFAVRVDGQELERLRLPGKPDPAMFLEAARRLEVVPAHSVVVEDAILGVAAGRAGAFGLVVGVDRTGNATSLRAHGADVVVPDLAEIELVK